MKRDLQPGGAEALRQRAQERLRQAGVIVQPLMADGASPQRLLHELQVYQVELELQNEHLQASRAWVEAALASYTELFDFAPVAYLTFDRNGSIIEANLAAARLLGSERARLLDKRFAPLVDQADRRVFQALLSRVFGDSASAACDITLAPGAGVARTVQVEVARTADGQACRAVLVDVSARKAREARASHLVIAFERAADAMLVTDGIGVVIDANAAFGALCGYVPATLAGQDGRALRLPGTDRAEPWRALALAGHWAGPAAYRHASGAPVLVEEDIVAVRDGEGNVLQYVSRLRHACAK